MATCVRCEDAGATPISLHPSPQLKERWLRQLTAKSLSRNCLKLKGIVKPQVCPLPWAPSLCNYWDEKARFMSTQKECSSK